MQISIDTSKDSHDDIRKAIALLQSIVSGGAVRTNAPNLFDNPVPGESAAGSAPAAPSLFNMFDAAAPVATPQAEEGHSDTAELETY